MTSTLEAPHADKLGDLQRAEWYLPFARIECHYFTNCAWIRDGQILEKQEIDKIRNIPGKDLNTTSDRVRWPGSFFYSCYYTRSL